MSRDLRIRLWLGVVLIAVSVLQFLATILIVLLLFAQTSMMATAAEPSCPPSGDSKNTKLQALDVLKNRLQLGAVDVAITLERILAPGDDTSRWHSSDAAALIGYVVKVKSGGAETANCHSKSQLDVHIELGLTPNAKPQDVMVVEVTPSWQPKLGGIAELRGLVGKRVLVTGDLFFDQEHWNNARNTGHAKNIWRATGWEIHPVTSIVPAN